MTCPPKPGFAWAYFALAMLMLATGTASLLAGRKLDHRPVATALAVILGADVVRTLIGVSIPCFGPYRGADRALFNVEESLYLFWPVVALVWLPLRVLVVERTRERSLLLCGAVAAWAALATSTTLLYPWLRGDPLRQLYLATELAALVVAVGALGTWVRRGGLREGAPRAAAVVVALLVAVELSGLFFGAWPQGLFGDAYVAQQASLVALYGVVAVVQGGAWWTARRTPS
jgi:hypothetical protein